MVRLPTISGVLGSMAPLGPKGPPRLVFEAISISVCAVERPGQPTLAAPLGLLAAILGAGTLTPAFETSTGFVKAAVTAPGNRGEGTLAWVAAGTNAGLVIASSATSQAAHAKRRFIGIVSSSLASGRGALHADVVEVGATIGPGIQPDLPVGEGAIAHRKERTGVDPDLLVAGAALYADLLPGGGRVPGVSGGRGRGQDGHAVLAHALKQRLGGAVGQGRQQLQAVEALTLHIPDH